MQLNDFEQLRTHILSRNTYFHHGFANAFRSDTTGAIWVQKHKDMQCLMPDDTLGNYFYLRNEPSIKYQPQYAERISDGGPQRLSFLDSTTVYLVAIVHNADAYLLMENLRNTVMAYADMNAVPSNSNSNREDVIADELQKMKADDVAAVLKRLTTQTIVRLTLNVSKVFIPGNCIVNPIKL